MKTTLFVDGYNMIGAWPTLKPLAEEDLSFARDALIGKLSEYAALTDQHVILVFDGHHRKNNKGTTIETDYLTILYTAEGVTADSVIERLCAKLPKYAHAYVATNDRLEQETILTQGALRLSARELYQMVYRLSEDAQKEAVQKETPRSYNALDNRISADAKRKLEALMTKEEKTTKTFEK